MASKVDLCNLSLGHVGNPGRVVSIDPVDGSAEADYCARFYNIARDEALELADWSFARTRATLTPLATNPSTTWAYAYAVPSDCLTPRRLVTGDTSLHEDDSTDFEIEGRTLLTNTENAVLIYTRVVDDTTWFSPGFITTFGYKMAAYLAGPLLRGESGANAAMALHKIAASKALEAAALDANRAWRSDEYVPSVVAARGGYAPATATGTNPVIYPPSGYAIS